MHDCPIKHSQALRIFAGQPDLAIEHVETSLRLSPRERMGTHLCAIGTAYFLKREFDEAAAKLLLSIQEHPGFPPRTAISPRATRTWGGSMRRAASSSGCAPSPLWLCRGICFFATPSTREL